MKLCKFANLFAGLASWRGRYVACLALVVFCTAASSTVLKAQTNELDAQLAQIGIEVKKQLSGKENADEIADPSAQKFVQGLRGIPGWPLSAQQAQDITASLAVHGFLMTADIDPDPTELEIEYYRLMWTDMIRLYAERGALSQADKDLIKAQVDGLLQTAETIAMECAPGAERDKIRDPIEYGRSLLYREMNDPVMPVLKRPLTKKEMEELKAMLRREIQSVMAAPDTEPDWIKSKSAGRLYPVMNVLFGKVWYTYYQRPKLSPEDMERMRAERRELNRIRREREEALQTREQLGQ